MSYKDVKDKAALVRDEPNDSANTAYRVGSILIEIAEQSEAEDAAFQAAMKQVNQDVGQLSTTLSSVQATQSSLQHRVGALEQADILDSVEDERRHAIAVVSAAPFDVSAEDYPSDIQQNSLVRNYTVVWFPVEGRFLGLSNGKYFDNWQAWKHYPGRDAYGASGVPIVGRLYRRNGTLYVWTGAEMVELYAALREACSVKCEVWLLQSSCGRWWRWLLH